MKTSCRHRELEYEIYSFTIGETLSAGATIVAILLLIAILFYRSVIAIVFLSPLSFFVWKGMKEKKKEQRKRVLSIQFKDCIQSVCANLKAGYSVENAFRESLSDVELLHGKESYMGRELFQIIQGLANNVSLEELLLSLGKRSGVTDIMEFGEVFAIAKRNGGNMTEVLVRTSTVIGSKMEIDREIQVAISAKRMEQQIMNMVPFAIIIYVSLTSPGFFDVLYHNTLGICIMTICLLVYMAAYRLSAKIINICTG